jgi:hypothetical protein
MPPEARSGVGQEGSSRDDPSFKPIEAGRQAVARPGALGALQAPGGLQEAQHRIDVVAPGIGQQLGVLAETDAQAQAEPGGAGFEGGQQVGARRKALRRLLGEVVALVAAPPDQLARQQAGIGFQRDALRVAPACRPGMCAPAASRRGTPACSM